MRFSWSKVPRVCGLLVLALLSSYVVGQATSGAPASAIAAFAPLEQWKAAVISGNPATLKALYSTSPAARVSSPAGESGVDSDVSFWMGLKARRIKLDVVQSESPQSGLQQVVFEAEVHSGTGTAEHTQYVMQGQLWQHEGGEWKLAATKRSDPTKLQQPTSTNKIIYAPGIDAHDEIKQALGLAVKQHKRVLVVFGANWCYDCHVLDLAFHRPDLAAVLQRNYEVVHIDVGEGDKNQDIMQQYQVPMKKGIPALAVLDSSGELLYSQQGGEFEKARSLAPQDLLTFLNKWKPAA